MQWCGHVALWSWHRAQTSQCKEYRPRKPLVNYFADFLACHVFVVAVRVALTRGALTTVLQHAVAIV